MHHFCALAGYGAEAINPYLAFETLEAHAARDRRGARRPTRRVKRYIKAIGKGMLKVMSKMGISTYQSYCGAQIFDAVGLQRTSSTSISPAPPRTIEGVGLARDRRGDGRAATRDAFGDDPVLRDMLDAGGEYAYRMRGEEHMWTPDAVAKLQHAVRGNSLGRRTRTTPQLINEQTERLHDDPRPVRVQDCGDRPQAGAARRGRAGGRDRQALLDRRHVASARSARGAHHARHRDEPHRRQVEHRRRRRGVRPLQAAAQRRLRCARRSSRSPRAASA